MEMTFEFEFTLFTSICLLSCGGHFCHPCLSFVRPNYVVGLIFINELGKLPVEDVTHDKLSIFD